jgi:hypothetical protein
MGILTVWTLMVMGSDVIAGDEQRTLNPDLAHGSTLQVPP